MVKVEGDPDEHTYFRVAETGPQTVTDGWIDVGNNLKLKVAGAETVTRKTGNGNETLVPVASGTTLTLTYRWNNPIQP
jgi:hypothetical protein